MKEEERIALLIKLIQELEKNRSWCGETHIQKASYFLQHLTRTSLNLKFILYKHGPYSHELADVLTFMKIIELLSVHYPQPFYGPNLSVTDRGNEFVKSYSKVLNKLDDRIKFVAKQIGDKGVTELEKLGTALFISQKYHDQTDHERAEMIHNLKPHISVEEARDSLKKIYGILEETKKLCLN